MAVIARRRPPPGSSARYVRVVVWRGQPGAVAGHSEDEGGQMAGGRRRGGELVPVSARSTEPLRFSFLSLFLSFPMHSSLKRLSNPLVSCYVVCRNEMTKTRHLEIKTPPIVPAVPPSPLPRFLLVGTYPRRRAAVRNNSGSNPR